MNRNRVAESNHPARMAEPWGSAQCAANRKWQGQLVAMCFSTSKLEAWIVFFERLFCKISNKKRFTDGGQWHSSLLELVKIVKREKINYLRQMNVNKSI